MASCRPSRARPGCRSSAGDRDGDARRARRAGHRRLARAGARHRLGAGAGGPAVAFNYAKAEATLADLRALGRAWAFKASVLDREALGAMVRAVEQEAGRLDILVNNAGIGQVVPLALMEEGDWDQMMDTHVKGAFLATQAVLRGMVKQRRGRILNVSSLAGVKMMAAPVQLRHLPDGADLRRVGAAATARGRGAGQPCTIAGARAVVAEARAAQGVGRADDADRRAHAGPALAGPEAAVARRPARTARRHDAHPPETRHTHGPAEDKKDNEPLAHAGGAAKTVDVDPPWRCPPSWRRTGHSRSGSHCARLCPLPSPSERLRPERELPVGERTRDRPRAIPLTHGYDLRVGFGQPERNSRFPSGSRSRTPRGARAGAVAASPSGSARTIAARACRTTSRATTRWPRRGR
jgi:NAD(P)-dependent dehydrogenase (short-subunit alcohol dehydrogenase family)